jgi:hypothetical protein
VIAAEVVPPPQEHAANATASLPGEALALRSTPAPEPSDTLSPEQAAEVLDLAVNPPPAPTAADLLYEQFTKKGVKLRELGFFTVISPRFAASWRNTRRRRSWLPGP